MRTRWMKNAARIACKVEVKNVLSPSIKEPSQGFKGCALALRSGWNFVTSIKYFIPMMTSSFRFITFYPAVTLPSNFKGFTFPANQHCTISVKKFRFEAGRKYY
eukprot:2937846-Rhodomonas_salina.1